MKIRCNSCDLAEAVVMCCADEAALYSGCDEKIHAANKLAEKHQRIPLVSASQMRKCDICQLAVVAALCVQYEAEFRPNMSIVVKALQPLLVSRPQSAAPPPTTGP